ncbi:MAG: hypothetical protein Q4B05_03400 [Candidatus Saccharibacteria bacterium]|nr:hypothetical protein [Candidatus Saccharibacteria bacterium]
MIEQFGFISYGDHDDSWSGADGWEIGGPSEAWAEEVVTGAKSKVDEVDGCIEALGGLVPDAVIDKQEVNRKSRYNGPEDFLRSRCYRDENYANNFWRLLGPVKPLAELIEQKKSSVALRQSLSGGLLGRADYKIWPVQYRVDAALPELMQPLRQLVESAASCGPVDIHKHLADLNRRTDGAVAKAVYAAYLLYLQLVQPADERRVTAWLWGKDEPGVLEAELITDAHQYLTR